jgi:hypothetical protein
MYVSSNESRFAFSCVHAHRIYLPTYLVLRGKRSEGGRKDVRGREGGSSYVDTLRRDWGKE